MNSFEKVIGHESVKAELIKFADVIKNNEKYAALGVNIPSGILLYGDPGVGKTLMAKAFIEEAGCDVFMIRKDMPNGEFVKHIKETFEEAKEHAPAIVFLDDMDKFANEDEEHKNAEEYIAVQSCIDDCRGMGIFTLATVNDMNCLPDSLLREGRFDKHIEVSNLRGKDSVKIIKYFLEQKKVNEDVDLEELGLVMEGKTCAFLETVINEAGIYAGFKNKEKLDHDDIVKAFLRMEFDVPECLESDEINNARYVAIHEAGHAVVREIIDPHSVTLVSIYKGEYSNEGIVRCHKSEKFQYLKELQEHDVIGALGGKAASEVILGKADMGCSEDMNMAFEKVSRFVDNYCSTGFNTFESVNPSEYLLANKDRLIASEIERYYGIAKQILIDNREFLDAVVEALVDHRTITYREMQAIRQKYVDCLPLGA